ncbi:MAG: NAD(P)H-dependent oxidoreductase [Betaproteobacteria bacterium]|nr:NAD(P)H-dependent oxidoreductase [Betaproteobacteria bacterium]
MARILVFAGSARRDSLNKKLARAAAAFAREAGAEATFVDLDDYPIPIYHGDLEAASGMPENAVKLRELFLGCDGLIIASPENNSSITALLKNTIDWLSRDVADGKGDSSGLAPWKGKVAGLMAASTGGFGGVRALPHLRQVLSALGVIVLGAQVAVPKAHEVFAADGAIADERVARNVRALAAAVAEATSKLN